MSIISFILLAIIGLAMAGISVFFVLIISKNMQHGRKFRRELSHNVKDLRMSKMVNAIGHDFNIYLHQMPVLKINQDMANCKNCSTTASCDEKLSQPALKAADTSFCPNHECLVQLSEMDSKAA